MAIEEVLQIYHAEEPSRKTGISIQKQGEYTSEYKISWNIIFFNFANHMIGKIENYP